MQFTIFESEMIESNTDRTISIENEIMTEYPK